MWEPTNIWQAYATTLLKHCIIIATYLGWMTSGHTIMVTEMHRDQLQILGKFTTVFLFIYEILSKVYPDSRIRQKSLYFHTRVAKFCPTKWFFFFFFLVKESITTFLSTQLATVLRVMYNSVVNQEEICLGCLPLWLHYNFAKERTDSETNKFITQKSIPTSVGKQGWAPDIISDCCITA